MVFCACDSVLVHMLLQARLRPWLQRTESTSSHFRDSQITVVLSSASHPAPLPHYSHLKSSSAHFLGTSDSIISSICCEAQRKERKTKVNQLNDPLPKAARGPRAAEETLIFLMQPGRQTKVLLRGARPVMCVAAALHHCPPSESRLRLTVDK